jgi:hypothetical protein
MRIVLPIGYDCITKPEYRSNALSAASPPLVQIAKIFFVPFSRLMSKTTLRATDLLC